MYIYKYENIENEPDMAIYGSGDILESGIHYDVENLDMINKSITGCFWDEDDACLCIYFTDELSQSDKNILDQIVNDNI